ncbi:MAG: glycosyltransferase family 4 protein [Syntrophorhabdales bacterium]|jgi:glycosyltransferase involved in cell wall biosynthesis
MASHPTVWFISEVYYPDEQGTAFYTTGLAEGLAEDFSIRVLCSYPTVTARGRRVRRKEVRAGVLIERCKGTTFDKNNIGLRFLNMVTYSLVLFVKAAMRVKKGDIVIAVTSPPSAPFIAKLVSGLRKARCILRVEDVYPETLVATGMIGEASFLNRFLQHLNGLLYRSVDHVVVLGRDMRALAEKKTGGSGGNVRIIRSWADADIVFPAPKASNAMLRKLGLENRFVVSCVGNMGRAQAIESIFEAANLLKADEMVHFLFVGTGAKRRWMEREIGARDLKNVTLVNQRPRNEQTIFLNACDISLVSLLPGMTGAGVPSRMYNIMAAGKPILAVTGEGSEVSLMVNEEGIGWAVPPSEGPEGIVEAILDARSDPGRLKEMGNRAYVAAGEKYSREKIINEYRQLLLDMRVPARPVDHAWDERPTLSSS